jgi:Uma2 family endonuclease
MLFLRSAQEKDFENKYVEDIPDLIAEIISPSDKAKRINRRVSQYLRRGIPLVWLIDLEKLTVTVCRPNEFPKVLDETDELTGNGVLPGFSCKVSELFAIPSQKSPRPKRRPRKGNRE